MITFTSKTGKTIMMRPPRLSDVDQLVNYINCLVDENTMVLIDENQTKKQELEYVNKSIYDIAENNLVHLLAFDGDLLIGNSQISRNRWKERHVGTFGISVHQKYRGLGIGKILASTVIQQAKENMALEKIILEAFLANKPAISLYKRLGFREYGRLPNGVKQSGEFMDRVFMYLDL